MADIKYKIRMFAQEHGSLSKIYELTRSIGAPIKYRREKSEQAIDNVRFINYWTSENATDRWFYYFLKDRGLLEKLGNKTLAFFSIFGVRRAMLWDDSDIKVFFTGENVQDNAVKYIDNALDIKEIDLSLGFENIDSERYMRFPLWIQYFVKPDARANDIRELCKKWNSPSAAGRNKFASHISSHDKGGIRKQIVEAMARIEDVDCAGKFMHNDDSLWQEHDNDKLEYLRQYKFNICPENTDRAAYSTEKLFEAIDAGCIPVYNGSHNKPEPDIIDQDAVIFWEKDEKNEDAIRRIRELYSSPPALKEFLEQSRVTDIAADVIIDQLDALEARFSEIIS